MATVVVPEVSLKSCDKKMPVIGMGTASYPTVDPETAKDAILEAIRSGYRHFDTAFPYRSEEPLGAAIVEALRLGLIKSRDELFITSKLWPGFAEKDMVVPAIKMSLRNLQLEYLDLYLIHMPLRLSQNLKSLPTTKENVFPLDIKSVWEGMEECKALGLTKAIGVSNFSCNKLRELLSVAKIPPAVNQMELSPLWQQKQLREFCKEKGIHVTAYSPLRAPGAKWGDQGIIGNSLLEDIANSKGKTFAQVSLRWVYEQGVSLIVKSFNSERMKQNLQIFDWSLTDEQTKKISQLPQEKLVRFASIVGPHDFVLEIDAEL